MSASLSKKEIVDLAIEIIIKAVLLGVILYYALSLLKPFIIPVLWAIIIAVTLSPLIARLEKRFPGKRTMIITVFTISAVAALLVPTYILSDSVLSSSQQLAQNLKEGSLTIPPPSESVESWPLVGEKIYALWNNAATDLENTLMQFKPQLQEYGGKIASAVGGALVGILQFVVSLIIAALFLSKSEGSVNVYHAVSRRLIGEKGVEWSQLAALTIRSVVQGVIGIAIIQSILSFIGLILIDVPLAWLWAFAVLFLAIIQLPPIIILGPIIAYVFSYADTTPATIFAVYAVIVSASDGFLKPLLLGRGVDIPMLVILLGAIGGMILSGILGLFVGAVGLALAYKLFMAWLEGEVKEEIAELTQKLS
ncbi:MAG: AI-2E family transporter [Epsilonproteobacteria bacterium]|nr:MAG: AI-2E family transporter [Campylobacterota bacterium]